jgi:hypothetical protein
MLAVEHAHLKAFVKGLPDALEHPVLEGWEDLRYAEILY